MTKGDGKAKAKTTKAMKETRKMHKHEMEYTLKQLSTAEEESKNTIDGLRAELRSAKQEVARLNAIVGNSTADRLATALLNATADEKIKNEIRSVRAHADKVSVMQFVVQLKSAVSMLWYLVIACCVLFIANYNQDIIVVALCTVVVCMVPMHACPVTELRYTSLILCVPNIYVVLYQYLYAIPM